MGFEQMGSNVSDCLQFARRGAAGWPKPVPTRGGIGYLVALEIFLQENQYSLFGLRPCLVLTSQRHLAALAVFSDRKPLGHYR